MVKHIHSKNESVHRVRQFMFDDNYKTLQLSHTTHTTRAAPNSLLALGLSCYTVSNNNEAQESSLLFKFHCKLSLPDSAHINAMHNNLAFSILLLAKQ